MNKLVIFDGNAIMHRAYHAIPSTLTTLEGEPINAVYGLVSMMLRVINDVNPTHLIFCFDRPEPTFRKKILKDYQGHRPDMDTELASQFSKAQKIIKAMDIPIFEKVGFEADDVIGTIAKLVIARNKMTKQSGKDRHASLAMTSVLIVTGDRDMLQLVGNNVKLYMPGRSLADASEYGEKQTVIKMGVLPKQIIDLKALTGDPSDNYKGVPGIGPVTAIKLLDEYDTLENIYKNVEKITGRVGELLKEHKKSAFQSQDLARIRLDVDVSFNFKDSILENFYNENSEKIFVEFSFNSIKKRTQRMSEDIQKQKQMTLM